MIVTESTKEKYRNKRGLMNIAGRVANVLFGTCNDVDAEYLYDKIKELEISKSITLNVNSSLLVMEKVQINLVDKYN